MSKQVLLLALSEQGLLAAISATLIGWKSRAFAMQTMTKKVQSVPQGYNSVTPYLVIDGAAKLIDFIKQTFGAEERERVPGPGGRIGHAELKIGDSIIMLADSTEEWRPMPGNLYVYVDEIDAVYRRALAAGAVTVREPKDSSTVTGVPA